MKAYNHSLDFTVLALAHAVDGDYTAAGKLLLKASRAHDVKQAVAILEASNAQAFANQQKASKQVKAAAKTSAKTRVRAFDIGDESDIDELIGDGDDEEEVDAELEDGEDEEEEEGEEDGDFDKAFASVLNGMKGRAKRK
jgi:hypothetical protein